MASQNYKVRPNNNRSSRPPQKSGGAFKWMLITGLLIGLVVFAVYVKNVGLKKIKLHHPLLTANPTVVTSDQTSALSPEMVNQLEQQPEVTLPPEAASELESAVPQFDFYTILPEKEVVVPDREIITRTREERANPSSNANTKIDTIETPTLPSKSSIAYLIQAGSFKTLGEAEKMRTNLASMGIEARIERAKVGDIVWNRIKMGPYTQMNSVSTIRARLRQNGIDVIVTEIGGR